MYLRHTTRQKDGKVHQYWQLVPSVRVGRKVVQQTVAHLGDLDAHGRARAKALARAITGDRDQPDLFIADDTDEIIPVRLKRIRLERGRPFGDVWLGGRSGARCGWMRRWRGCCPRVRKRCRGPRWPRCSRSRACASPPANYTSPRPGIVAWR